jgi:hypothetical protein
MTAAGIIGTAAGLVALLGCSWLSWLCVRAYLRRKG